MKAVSVAGECEIFAELAGPVVLDGLTTNGISGDGLTAANSSAEAAVENARGQTMSAMFASLPNHVSPQLNAVALARKADGALVMPGTVRALDRSFTASGAGVSQSPAATPSLAVGARWFTSAVSTSPSYVAAKVEYDTAGVLRIPQSSLPAGFDIHHTTIMREGRALTALAVTQDALIVFGQGYEDDYTKKDVLLLRSTSGPTVSGAITQAQGLFGNDVAVNTDSPASVATNYHDVYFDYGTAFRPYQFAPWFSGKYLSASAEVGSTQNFPITLPDASGGAAALTVNLWSLTQSSSGMEDHALQVSINGQPVGQAVWTGGNKMMQLTFEVDSEILSNGKNTISLITPPIAGLNTQIAFLHSISISYTRRLNGSNPIQVSNLTDTAQRYEVNSLSSAGAWVVDTRFADRAALVPFQTQAQPDGTYTLRFDAAAGGTGTYLVVPAGMENAPLSVSRRIIQPVKTNMYIATGPSQFGTGIQPLLAQRTKEGVRGLFVDQEQIFDYYGYGRYGPAAIQKMIRAVRPQYLLLLGRTTYDYKNYSGLNVDPLCPTFLVSTSFWAQSTSDSTFGDLGRGYSEVAVGRLPIENAADLTIAVQRILSYKGPASSGIRAHIIADQVDLNVADFPVQAAGLAQSNPELSWQANYLGVTYQNSADVTSALTQAANGGADWLIYVGHGNASRLGRLAPSILDTTTVQAWTGNVVFLQSTCTANWAANNTPGYKSIAMQALTQPQGGISASIATSTYMNSGCAVDFMNQLIKNVDATGMRWGTALMKTQQWAHAKGGSYYLDLSKTEQIFGDPAMPVFMTAHPATGTSETGGTNGPVTRPSQEPFKGCYCSNERADAPPTQALKFYNLPRVWRFVLEKMGRGDKNNTPIHVLVRK